MSKVRRRVLEGVKKGSRAGRTKGKLQASTTCKQELRAVEVNCEVVDRHRRSCSGNQSAVLTVKILLDIKEKKLKLMLHLH